MDDARLTQAEALRLLRSPADQPLSDPDLTGYTLIARVGDSRPPLRRQHCTAVAEALTDAGTPD